jgi:5,10-methylene-tetrahydrofolate dehydrogenase/methenyl tetrahydrofolate cyclohydrolase
LKKNAVGHVTGLVVVLVGDWRVSKSYVRLKVMGREEVGIKSLLTDLQNEVVDSLSRFRVKIRGYMASLCVLKFHGHMHILSAKLLF